MPSIYETYLSSDNCKKKQLAVLIDPDDVTPDVIIRLVEQINSHQIDFILVGGSLLVSNRFESTLETIKSVTNIPVIIFPGSTDQISGCADAILLLSLISGRNPELLIGKHVLAAPKLKASGLEIIPTGYMLVDGGAPTTASYMSNTLPLPADKPEIAATTAMAGEMLGLKTIYLDAGSGAKCAISEEMIRRVAEAVSIPLWVGGGINTVSQLEAVYAAGAQVAVIGNAIEKQPNRLAEFAAVNRSFQPIFQNTGH